MANKDFENIYRFEITTRLRPLVSGGAGDARARAEAPGGRRYHLEYVEGKLSSPRLDGAAVARRMEALLERAFGKPLQAIGESDARGLQGCRDADWREAIAGEIQATGSGELCASGPGLQRFLERYTRVEELRRARGPLARRLVEAAGADLGLEAEIISSGDWAFLRLDGVFCLDSRFTVRTADGTLISGHLLGRADVRQALGGGANLDAYRRWEEGQLDGDRHELPLHGLLRLEVAGDPGDKALFAAPRWMRAGNCFWKYQHLSRGLFLAAGALVLDRRSGNAEAGFATALQLSVHEVQAPVAAPARARDQAAA